MATARGQFDELLAPGARKVYVDEYNELGAIYPGFMNVDTTGRAFEDDLVMTGLPVAVRRGEGEPIPFDRPKFRGKVRYIPVGYALGYEITREAVEDDLYGALNSQGASNLARSMREAEEVASHTVLNNSFTTIEGYDGVSIINTAHPGVGDLEFSNRPTTPQDLSVASLKAAMENFMKMQNDRGLRIMMRPANLIVPTEGWWTAQEILQTQFRTFDASGGDPMDSEHGKNVAQDMSLTPMQSPYLVDPDAWWLTVPKAQHKMNFFWRRRPDPVNGYDGRNEVSWFGITARFSVGVTDWRGLYGSPGS
jgi:hypothetical protein